MRMEMVTVVHIWSLSEYEPFPSDTLENIQIYTQCKAQINLNSLT